MPSVWTHLSWETSTILKGLIAMKEVSIVDLIQVKGSLEKLMQNTIAEIKLLEMKKMVLEDHLRRIEEIEDYLGIVKITSVKS